MILSYLIFIPVIEWILFILINQKKMIELQTEEEGNKENKES